jgi:hypothetical protein
VAAAAATTIHMATILAIDAIITVILAKRI